MLSILAGGRTFSATVHPIFNTGATSNRVDVVFLAEGYTSAQSAKFLLDCTNAANALFSQEPFSSYRGIFNVSAIFVASAQSGSDHPAYGVYKDTFFNSSYDSVADFVIALPIGSQGTAKVQQLLSDFAPGAELPVVVVNDPLTGGSDGFGIAAVVSASAGMADILTHEAGHVLAGLGDEYDWPFPGYPDIEEPNTTRNTNRASIKWRAWIEPTTPLPTPETFEYYTVVGLFEGAHYKETGWYRPRFDCKMNHSAVPFCEVCREALVLAFYTNTTVIQSFSPSSTNVSIPSQGDTVFSISVAANLATEFQIAWLTNGFPVLYATNTSLALSAFSMSSVGAVKAVVADKTRFVRTDPSHLLIQEVAWTITPPLRLDNLEYTIGGGVSFRISGDASGIVVQGSTNLIQWMPLQTNVLTGGHAWFTNAATHLDRAFFRAVTLP